MQKTIDKNQPDDKHDPISTLDLLLLLLLQIFFNFL